MKYSGEQRDDAGEERSLAPWIEKIGLKLVPFLAVAALITLFLTHGVLVALTAFLVFAVLYYLVSWFIKVFKKIT